MRKFYNLWVIFTLMVYYLGPIPWPGAETYWVLGYVLICLGAFNVGCILGDWGRAYYGGVNMPSVLNKGSGIYLTILVYLIISSLHVEFVTGKSMFDLASWSLDFGEAYKGFQETISNQDEKVPAYLLLLKAAIFPLILYLLVVNIKRNKLIAIAISFPFIASSILRGTDMEVASLLIIIFVAAYYHGLIGGKVHYLVIALVAAAYMFVERKIARFEIYHLLPDCLPDTLACFDFQSYWALWFSPFIEIGRVFGAQYLTQGYEGLDMAFDLDYEFNFGIGHLPPLKSSICSVMQIGCEIGDFQAKLTDIGWDMSRHWASVYTVLANDFHWILVPMYFVMLGWLFSAADRAWKLERKPEALVAIILITDLFIFSSANMQIAVSLEWIAATVLFVYLPVIYALKGGRGNEKARSAQGG